MPTRSYETDFRPAPANVRVSKEMYFDTEAYLQRHPELSPEELTPLPINSLTPDGKPFDHIALIRMLSRCPNPDTGKLYTPHELAEIFRLLPNTIYQHLRNGGIGIRPKPEVRHETLPENEKAFYAGIKLGDFTTRKVHRTKEDMVVLTTKSPGKAQLLHTTLGQWGQMTETVDGTSVYLNADQFDFLENLKVDAKFLDAKARVAPFLLGLLAVRLSPKGNRLSLHYSQQTLTEMLLRKYRMHFGEELGTLRVEKVTKSQMDDALKKPSKTNWIYIKDPGAVIATISQHPAVHTLPFFKNLGEILSQN